MSRLIGRAAADADLASRRAEIERRNQLARAVRLIAARPAPVVRLVVGKPRVTKSHRKSSDFCQFESGELSAGRWARKETT